MDPLLLEPVPPRVDVGGRVGLGVPVSPLTSPVTLEVVPSVVVV